MNRKQTAKQTGARVTPRTIAIAYFAALLVFAGIYYWMADPDFYHQSIKYEPNSVPSGNILWLGG